MGPSGDDQQIVVEFPVEGWRLSAGFEATGERCARTFSTRLEEIEPGRFLLTPAGYADEYDVTLSGRGPGGDPITVTAPTATSPGTGYVRRASKPRDSAPRRTPTTPA